jgi:hypothetical protein
MRHIINSQGFRGLGAVNVTRQPLTMCPDNADCSGPIVRDRVPIAPVSGSTNGTIPGETQPPPADPSCPPGSSWIATPNSGSQLGLCIPNMIASVPVAQPVIVTPGASAVATSVAVAAAGSPCSFALFGDTTCYGPIGSTTALVIGALVAALFIFGGKK